MRANSSSFHLRLSTALTLSFCAILAGCGYLRDKPSILPPYIHRIAVRPFSNHTQQYGLEDKLTLAVQSEFTRDGRYAITNEAQGDAVVVGDITKYILDPLSYNANHVPVEYKLWISAEVSFEDKVKGGEMWREKDLHGELRYYVASSGFAGALSEDDARQVIFDELSRDIRSRTIEGLSGRKKIDKNETIESTGTVHEEAPVDTKRPDQPSETPSNPSPPAVPY